MKRKEIFAAINPLLEQLYQFSYALLPDELEAEQLLIDGVNGFVIKEKKWLSRLETGQDQLKLRRVFFKKIIFHIYDLASKRVGHFKLNEASHRFHQLPIRTRAIMTLRYQMNYDPESIEDFLDLARWEVIEGIHNGRFILMDELNTGII